MLNIQDWREKINILADETVGEWGIVAIVFLVAFAAFYLGRLSALEQVKPPVALENAALTAKVAPMAMGGLIVASRGGSAYYYPWCTGASKLTPANQVWFASEAEARNAGYSPAKSCAGLGTP